MSVLARIGNLLRGFASLFIADIEKANPGIAYENAINQRSIQYSKLKEAASAIIRRRDQLSTELVSARKELVDIDNQLQAAIRTENRELGTILLQKQKSIASKVERLEEEVAKAVKQSDDVKASLNEVMASIHQLKEERDDKLAQIQSANARIKIQEQLDGISLDADIKALDNVREHINNKIAEADLGDELKENDIDAKLKKLRQQAGQITAESEFDALLNAQKKDVKEFKETIQNTKNRG